jgi:hypothetical protein
VLGAAAGPGAVIAICACTAWAIAVRASWRLFDQQQARSNGDRAPLPLGAGPAVPSAVDGGR